MRLIDADELKDIICSNVYPVADAFNSRDYGMLWTGGIEKAIDDMPTVDPVKHGRWVEHDSSIKDVPTEACSECGEWSYGYNEKYCPNCGARMDDEDEHEID